MNRLPTLSLIGLLLALPAAVPAAPDPARPNVLLILDFIKASAKDPTPFLAYYATCLPHYPWEPTPDSRERTYRAADAGHKGDPKYSPDMVACLDKQICVMLQTLDDLSDMFPTLCNLTGAKLPGQTIHGRSFAPQLLGKPGNPREWIHIQNAGNRQVRNSDYMPDNKNQLRRVVQLWEEPAKPNENKAPETAAAARKMLQAVFDALGK